MLSTPNVSKHASIRHGRRGADIDAQKSAARRTHATEFDAEERLFIAVFDGLADEHLVVPGTVVVAGVQECHAGVECGPDGGDGFCIVARCHRA